MAFAFLTVGLMLCTSVLNGSTMRHGLSQDGVAVGMPAFRPRHSVGVDSRLWSASGVLQSALCTLARYNARSCLGLRGGKGTDGAIARANEKVVKKPHYKVRAAARAQKEAASTATPASRVRPTAVKGKRELHSGLRSPIALREQTHKVDVGEEESEAAQQGGNDEVDAQDADMGVGWEAVGAGVTNARDLLGLAPKREWTNHRGSVVSKKPRCAFGFFLFLLLLCCCSAAILLLALLLLLPCAEARCIRVTKFCLS